MSYAKEIAAAAAAAESMWEAGKWAARKTRKRRADWGQTQRKMRRTIKDFFTGSGRRGVRRVKAPPKRSAFKPTGPVRATFGKKFRKGKKPKVNSKFTKRHFDDFGTAERDHTLYAGFQTHGSMSRVCNIYAEALVRYLLSTIGIRPATYDEIVCTNYTGTEHDVLDHLYFGFKSIDDQTGADSETNATITVIGETFESICDSLATSIESKLASGQYPTYARFYKQIGGTNIMMKELRDLEGGKLTVYVKQVIRIQNLTPNDAGGTDMDVTGTNPIQGKIYDFTTTPLLRPSVQAAHPDLDTFQDHRLDTGVNLLADSSATGSGGVLGHPPNAAELFTNCRKVASVRISAGANKYKTTLYSFKGSLVDFMKRFKYGDKERALGGGITYLGFENAFRSGQDKVKIAFNRELSMSAHYQVLRKKPMLRHYEQNDMGDTA